MTDCPHCGRPMDGLERAASKGDVYTRLMSWPWNLGLAKAQGMIDRGMNCEILGEWERYAIKHGRQIAQKMMQQFLRPSLIPRDPARAKGGNVSRVGEDW